MGYIKVAYREILKKLDCSDLPKGWNNFIQKQEVKQNLIIKSSKNKCFCTNCKHEFISKKKINEETKCPNCYNKYLIKRSNLRHFSFKDYLSILDIVNNEFVIRYFELRTIIDANHEHCSSVVEFAREIVTNNWYREMFVNEKVSRCQCYIYINHNDYFKNDKWRQYTRNYSLIDNSIVFPNNLKEVLKNTEYKYSGIWDIVKHSSYINLLRLLKADVSRIEFLSKMKLYKLALETTEFKSEGSFYKIFGVPKDYYVFMKRYNITYNQLEILRLLKEKDISKIRYLESFCNKYNLEEISKYINLNRFIKYSKMHHKKIKPSLYKDYLRFAKFFGFDLKNNRYAFPKNLKEEHDKLEKQYEIQNKKIIKEAIIKRSKGLLVNTYKDNKFIILPACTLNDLYDESEQQGNCVRTYAEKYAFGDCDIYFMRDVNEQNKSLVTVEVKNNRIVQSKIKNNYEPNENQIKFLKKWENSVLKGVA